MKHYSTKAKNRVYLQAGGLAATSGSGEALCIFRLTLELCGYKPHGVLDASPSCILSLLNRPFHHRLLRDLRVPTPEAHQHVLCHYLYLDTALCLQLATDDLLQL
jgi:hypothetical protein